MWIVCLRVHSPEVLSEAHHAPPTEETQSALVHGLVFAGHGDGDLVEEEELQSLPGAPNVGFVGSVIPEFFHRAEN